MARLKSSKPKKNVWKDALYGTYDTSEGYGDYSDWQRLFGEAWNSRVGETVLGMDEDTPWGILGLPTGASQEGIKAAFRKLSKIYHPDVGGDPEKFKKMYAAYLTLYRRN